MKTTIFISIISIIGLIFSLKRTGLFQKIVTVGLAISVIFIWVGDKNALLISILLQLGLAFITTIYAIGTKGLKIINRFALATIGLILAFGNLAMVLHYPGQGELRLALTIPIILFFWTTLKDGRQQPKEFGFMLIWTAISAVHLINYLMK